MLRRLENWTPVSVGSVSMGQEIGVTPLQMIMAMSAMANGGLIVRPHVVRALRRGTQMAEPPQPQPRRVIRATTAATMRRMLEGVVLNGTGKRARLDGYTSAGKTGTAQKFDITTGHYSPHQLIASFVGFAPINTPAVTILVQLDSPVGMHEGGQVAAPTFKRVAQQVLAYLDVPHDLAVPNSVLLANRQHNDDRDLADVTDFNPIQVDTAAVVMDNVPGVLEQARGSAVPTIELAEGEGIPVPRLQGRTVREVTEQCMKLGLSPVLVGTGIAVEQSPDPGAMTRRGSRITVRFARDASVVSAAARRGAR
jgi:membrane peptidoglycan carboxypeptidase